MNRCDGNAYVSQYYYAEKKLHAVKFIYDLIFEWKYVCFIVLNATLSDYAILLPHSPTRKRMGYMDSIQ